MQGTESGTLRRRVRRAAACSFALLLLGLCLVLLCFDVEPPSVRALKRQGARVTWARQEYGWGQDVTICVLADGVSERGFAELCHDLGLERVNEEWRSRQHPSIRGWAGWPGRSGPAARPGQTKFYVTKTEDLAGQLFT